MFPAMVRSADTSRVLVSAWLLGAALLPLAGPASAQDRLACSPEQERGVQVFADSVRAAKPGDPRYVPVPFPTSDRDVLIDFDQQVRRMFQRPHREGWTGMWQRLEEHTLGVLYRELSGRLTGLYRGQLPQYQRLMDVLDDDGARFEVVRGENWSFQRCGALFPLRNWFLVRIFQRADGVEIARFVLSQAGLLGHGGAAEPGVPLHSLLTPEQLPKTRNAPAAEVAGAVRYVTTYGDRCYEPLVPCIARQAATSQSIDLLMPPGVVFRVSLVERLHVVVRDARYDASYREAQRGLAPGERLVALGPEVYGVAEPIAPP